MALVPFSEEWKPVLLLESAGFTNSDLLATELQTKYNLFQLQVLKPPVVDVANPLVPQVDIRFDLLSFGKQGGADIVGVEDEHPPILVPFEHPTLVELARSTT